MYRSLLLRLGRSFLTVRSLDDFIDARLGRPRNTATHSNSDPASALDDAFRSRSDRIRAFRAARYQPEEERERRKAERIRGIRTAVHLLSAEEVKHLFRDVVSGLGFLVNRRHCSGHLGVLLIALFSARQIYPSP